MSDETSGTSAGKPTEVTIASAGPNAHRVLKIYAHSPILYWWPVWALGFLFFLFSAGLGDAGTAARVQGLTFVFTLTFVIFSTTVRLRGANSVIFGLILAIGLILLFMGNLFDPLANFIGQLDVRMSKMFYLVMGVLVFLMWVVMIFGFDRVKFYEIAAGQVRERLFWGAGDRAESGANARCRYHADDFLRHRMLGLVVTGDIEITLANGETWYLHNVIWAKRKARLINDLIVTRPVD